MKELSMHILDIVQNSIRAKANLIRIEIKELTYEKNKFIIGIEDNGSGILSDDIEIVKDPFYTTAEKKTGLGLALLDQNAKLTGGNLKIESEKGKGTSINADFIHSHIDRQPLGDIASTITCLIRTNPEIDFIYIHTMNEKQFKIDTRQIKTEIGDIEINNSQIISFIKDLIKENLEEIKQ